MTEIHKICGLRMLVTTLEQSDFAKPWSLGFRLDSGEARIQAKPASQKPGGVPSRLAWVHSPGLALSAGG